MEVHPNAKDRCSGTPPPPQLATAQSNPGTWGRRCRQKQSRLSSITMCVAHAVSSSHTHFYFLLEENRPKRPRIAFSAWRYPPWVEAPLLQCHSRPTKHQTPGPHVRCVSCTRSVTLTLTPTHRRVPLCVSPAKSIARCSAWVETNTNKSWARSQPTDGKCGSMQVII